MIVSVLFILLLITHLIFVTLSFYKSTGNAQSTSYTVSRQGSTKSVYINTVPPSENMPDTQVQEI